MWWNLVRRNVDWWNICFGKKCSGEIFTLVKNALVKHMFCWKMLCLNVCFGEKCSVDIYVLVPWNAMNEHWLPQLSSWDELALDLLFQISNAIVQWCHCTGNVLWCNVLGRNVLWWNIFGCKYHLGIISHWIFLLFQISNALQRSRNCDKNKLKKAYTIEWNHKCILFCWSFLVVIKAFF